MPTFPIRSAPLPLSPTGFERPWRDWTMMPVAAVTLAQMWAVQVYAQLVLGRWQGEVGQTALVHGGRRTECYPGFLLIRRRGRLPGVRSRAFG
jgi:hypothetical protein